jgi:phospholipase C
MKRTFVAAAAVAGAALIVAAPGAGAGAAHPQPRQQPQTATPIKQVVVIFQENHSFDNVLGLLCIQGRRCDGSSTGRTHDGQIRQLTISPDHVPEVAHTL